MEEFIRPLTTEQEKVAEVCNGLLRSAFNPLEYFCLVTSFACTVLQEMTDEDTAISYQDQITKIFDCCIEDYSRRNPEINGGSHE